MISGAVKRLMDVIVAVLILFILSPVLLMGCLAVLFSMGRPIFFIHERSGKNGTLFHMIKLRTMLEDPCGQMTDRERVTGTGLLLRKFSIDELPQLLNVLDGSMSLVGPRPLLREYDAHYSAEQSRRLLVKPGLTGLAQVTGRNELSWEDKLALDRVLLSLEPRERELGVKVEAEVAQPVLDVVHQPGRAARLRKCRRLRGQKCAENCAACLVSSNTLSER